MANPANESVDEIRTKFDNGIYNLDYAPRILEADPRELKVHKDGINQNELFGRQTSAEWDMDMSNKLMFEDGGDFVFWIDFASTKYFESRETFDFLYGWGTSWGRDWGEGKRESGSDTSLEQVLDSFRGSLSCNMDYYLANPREMALDLGLNIDEVPEDDVILAQWDRGSEAQREQLEEQLLRALFVKIFGEDIGISHKESMPSVVNFKDYRILDFDGNHTHATAQRGDKYFMFYIAEH